MRSLFEQAGVTDEREELRVQRMTELEEVVYLVDGGQLYNAPYLPGEARDEVGW